MNILLTGAFGNIGTSVIRNYIEKNNRDLHLRCFDVKNETSIKRSEKYDRYVEAVWGDLRNTDDVRNAVENVDAIIHLAFIIPPLSEKKPDLAREINIAGTKNLIGAAVKQNSKMRIIFASSVSVYGPADPDRKQPLKATDDVKASDNYTLHKIECEKMVRQSGQDWVITRFGVVPPLAISGEFDPVLFEISLDTRVEFVHTMDVGLALVNAAVCEKCSCKVLLIGGGKSCQMYQKEFLTKFLEINGIGMLPDSAFSTKPYYTDWMDTEESQELLKYQTRTFDDYINEMKKIIGARRYFAKLLKPIIQRSLLEKSPYYQK